MWRSTHVLKCEETKMRLATPIVLAVVFSFGGAIALSQDGPPKPKVSKDAMTDEQMAV